MSDQQKGAGHHAITREAVAELFASRDSAGNPRAVDGRIDGMTEEEYFQALDAAQHKQDEGLGTLTPAEWAPEKQREHGLADPSQDGMTNLHNNEQFVLDQLEQADQAHQGTAAGGQSGTAAEIDHLGKAAHSLEDSYSNAHAFRGDSVDSGDPHAPVESYNVFDPADTQSTHAVEGGALVGAAAGAAIGSAFGGVGAIPGAIIGGVVGAATGWFANNEIFHDGEGTHDDRFDHVPTDGHMHPIEGSDLSGAHATAEMLESYYDHRDGADHAAAFQATVDQDFQPGEHGVGVNRDNTDPAWQAERDRRLEVHQQQEADWHAAHSADASPDGGTELPDADVPAGGVPGYDAPDGGTEAPDAGSTGDGAAVGDQSDE